MTDYTVNEGAEVELLDRDILYIKGVAPWWGDLIALSEEAGGWTKSMELLPTVGQVVTTKRNSNQISIAGSLDSRFTALEKVIFDTVAFGIVKYTERNPYYHITEDEGYVLLRYNEGHFYGEHSDAHSHHVDKARVLSFVLYLNDDYEGGEVSFSRQGVVIKPKCGSLVIFPSTGTHPHEALKVTKGTKYAVVTWAK